MSTLLLLSIVVVYFSVLFAHLKVNLTEPKYTTDGCVHCRICVTDILEPCRSQSRRSAQSWSFVSRKISKEWKTI